MTVIFSIIILIFSIVIHEVSHAYSALFLGDKTAKYAGRLTLNPIAHMELFGSVIVPVLTSLLPGGVTFGWAKPVPVNTYNLKFGKWGEAIVAFAGPFSNITIALLGSLFIRLGMSGALAIPEASIQLLILIVLINMILAIFNLVPLPPLDGSKILFALLPPHLRYIREFIERHTLIIILVFIFILWRFIEPIIPIAFRFLTGIAF